MSVAEVTRIRTFSGGGGVSGLAWNGPAGFAPIASEEVGGRVYKFQAGADSKLVTFIKIPESRVGSKQIKLKINVYSESVANNIHMKATTYVLNQNSDLMDSVVVSRVSTNVAVTNTSPSKVMRTLELDLTDSTGKINGSEVIAGQTLRVELYRNTDTDTADITFVPAATEVVL